MRIEVLGILLCACVLGEAMGEVYKYQDKDGRWHFSDRPHPGSMATPPAGGIDSGSERKRTGSTGTDATQDLVARLGAADESFSPIQLSRLSVVKIDSEIGNGSGFFVSDDGFILTNRHVVRPPEGTFDQAEDKLAEAKIQLDRMKRDIDRQGRPCRRYANTSACEDAHRNHRRASISYRRAQLDLDLLKRRTATARSFSIQLQDKTKLKASLVAVGSQHDVALLKLEGYRTPFLTPPTERTIADAETLYVIGSPLGIADQVSSGNFTGVHGGLLGTNAKVFPGNSGGPMVNKDGRVIGVVTIKVTAGEDPRKASGLGFAIPIEAAFMDLPQILN